MRLRVCEERVRLASLDDAPGVQYDDAVVIEDCVEFVRDGDDGVVAEFLADDSLHDLICLGVDAVFEAFVSHGVFPFWGVRWLEARGWKMIAKAADPVDVSARIGLHMQGMDDRSQKERGKSEKQKRKMDENGVEC